MTGGSIQIRPATAADAETIADIYLLARHASTPNVTWSHDGPEVRSWVAEKLVPAQDVYVAEASGILLGFVALQNQWVAQLYVHPDHWRCGAGTALMHHAKTLRPDGLRLWCFEYNQPGQAFYDRHGFTIISRTDGHGNAENQPDILYNWSKNE